MPSLPELQRAFAAAVLDRGDRRVLAWIHGGAMGAEARLDVYRNNAWHNYREALRDVYPVIERLVGEDFFRYAADGYIARHRSRQGNLHAYGGRFAGFLRRLPQAAGLPYLPWVARLEWLIHESFHAADHPPLICARLAAVAPQDYGALRFVMHPSCRLLAAPCPVQHIWQANQPDAGGEADLSAGPVCLLIRRPGDTVVLEPLSAGAFALLSQCTRGHSLATSLAAAQAHQPGFDLTSFLAQRIGDATLVDLRP
jgi:hypothetical protein